MTHDDEMKLHTLLSEMHTDAQTVNLHVPRPIRSERSFCSDAPTEVDTRPGSHQSPARRGAKRERALHSGQDATSMSHEDDDPSVRREHHNKHTRKCRARLKQKFDAVLDMLPDPAPNQEVKHKVQILDYAMQMFNTLGAELTELEMTLALHSHHNLLRWVDTFARKEQDISSALRPFLDIFCSKRAWVYAEVWRPANADPQATSVDDDAPRDMFVEDFVVKESPWCSKHMTDKLRLLGERFVRTQEVIPSTDRQLEMTVETLQPQVTNGLVGFDNQRSRLLAEAGIGTSMLVPVTVDAEVVRIVAFYDIRERQVDAETKRLAVFIATSIGNVHNAAVQERGVKHRQVAGGGRGGPSSRARA